MTEEILLAYLTEINKPASLEEIVEHFDANHNEVLKTANSLEGKGLVVEVKPLLWKVAENINDQSNENIKMQVPIYFKMVVQYLAEDNRHFFLISDILKKLNIKDTNNELASAFRRRLVKDKMVEEIEEGGVRLKEKGLEWLDNQNFGWENSETPPTQNTTISNTGTFIHGSNFNQSPLSNFDQSRPINMPTQAATNSHQNSFWSKTLNWIMGHIVHILLGILLAYIVYRLGWN